MKVIWTKFAFRQLELIYGYYKRNVSQTVANNIRHKITTVIIQLENHPHSGTVEELLEELNEGHRYIVRGNYKVIYKIADNVVFITDVFDTRQNPDKMVSRNK